MHRNIYAIRYLLSLILIVTGGCASLSQGISSTPTPLATIQQTESTTPTATALPTPTFLPPINEENAVETMANLLQQNGGCQLPCLFGLHPESSESAAVKALVEYFQKNNMETESISLGESVSENSGRVNLVFQKDSTRVDSSISYYYKEGQLDILTLGSEGTDDFHRDYDNPYGVELTEYYQLPNILTLYGPPPEVMIMPFPTDPNRPSDPYPFSLVLYYKEKGFLVEYISLRQEQGEYFAGCYPTSYINLVSWSPEKPKSLMEIVTRIGSAGINTLNMDYYKPLEEVTDLTITEFYDTFRNLDGPKCILTSKELWPEPVLSP